MDTDKLTLALRCVLPAVSRDSSRKHISCVQIRVKSGVATVAGTDGHRLHMCEFLHDAPDGEWLFRFGTAKVGKSSVANMESGVLTSGPTIARLAGGPADLLPQGMGGMGERDPGTGLLSHPGFRHPLTMLRKNARGESKAGAIFTSARDRLTQLR